MEKVDKYVNQKCHWDITINNLKNSIYNINMLISQGRYIKCKILSSVVLYRSQYCIHSWSWLKRRKLKAICFGKIPKRYIFMITVYWTKFLILIKTLSENRLPLDFCRAAQGVTGHCSEMNGVEVTHNDLKVRIVFLFALVLIALRQT